MASEKLIISLEADTQKLNSELKKVDGQLNSLESSTDKADKGFKSFEVTAGKIATGVAAVGAAATAAATALAGTALAAANYAREIKIAAKLSGTTAEQIQLISQATATVGISMEQLGDISKDTLEKIGDYLNTGGGGFMDYVDAMKLTEKQAIATANEFKTMSGPAVLQEMVKRMEAAGVSGVQMSHALEGMASETTRLIPLLENSGKKMAELVDTASKLTIPLSTNDIEKFDQLKISTDNAAMALKSLGEQTLLNLSDMFIRTADNAAKFIAMLNKGTAEYNNKRLEEIREELSEIGHAAENAQTPLGRFWNVLTFNTHQQEFADKRVNELLKERAKLYEENAKILESSTVDPVGLGIDSGNQPTQESQVKPKKTEDENATKLALIADRFKSEEELLREKLNNDLAIIGENAELEAQLYMEYDENLAAMRAEKQAEFEQAKSDLYWENLATQNQEKFDAEIAAQQELLSQKLINEEEYLKAVNDSAKKYGKIAISDKKTETKKKEGYESDYAMSALQIGEMLFEGNKALEAGLVVAKTGAAVMHQLGSGDPYTAFARAGVAGAIGAVQLAQTLGASKGGGSISAPSQTSAPSSENTNRVSSSVEINESISSGSNQQNTSNTVTITADDGDELATAFANMIQKKITNGELKLG